MVAKEVLQILHHLQRTNVQILAERDYTWIVFGHFGACMEREARRGHPPTLVSHRTGYNHHESFVWSYGRPATHTMASEPCSTSEQDSAPSGKLCEKIQWRLLWAVQIESGPMGVKTAKCAVWSLTAISLIIWVSSLSFCGVPRRTLDLSGFETWMLALDGQKARRVFSVFFLHRLWEFASSESAHMHWWVFCTHLWSQTPGGDSISMTVAPPWIRKAWWANGAAGKRLLELHLGPGGDVSFMIDMHHFHPW